MALNVRELLAGARPQWAPLYAKMVADFEALDAALGQAGTQATTLAAGGSTGYTSAKDLAEVAVLDAAMPVLRGLKALQLDAPDPALAPLAAYTRTSLDELRDLTQVKTLRALHTVALARTAALAEERVTAAQVAALDAKIAAFEPLVGTPRQATTAAATLREQSVASLGAARTALKRLDVRVPNLVDDLPELVAQYKKARIIVDAGHGPKPDSAKA
ncbi:hypothetical protein GCM10022409_40150 [Hymenobacter glaciei]|uniref:Uncharacterized protein n=2 Tax=Hymenobacter glaciei TaxID=877209 RepID=A0ABP7UPY2_9BACT